MQYSTIQEAYNIDCLKPSKKSSKSSSQNINIVNNSSPPYNIENNSVASNKESVNYNNSGGGSCSPIQAPTYNIPISGDCKKERDIAMKTYIEENFKTESAKETTTNNVSKDSNISKNRQDNIMPFYDEDMEQYFDINNLVDEVKYNSGDGTKIHNYMPNHNKNSYTNDNTGEYSRNNNGKYGVNLLNTVEYNLSAEERKKAQEALEYLKIIEDKINKTESGASNATLETIRRSNNTGPVGFGKTTDIKDSEKTNEKEQSIKQNSKTESELLESIKENKKTENIFNMIINIFIFIFIGAFIILICDYITELAIQIGRTRTSNILDPYIKYNIYMQHHFQHLNNLANNNMTHPNIPLPHNGIAQGIPMIPNLMTGINDIHGITNKI